MPIQTWIQWQMEVVEAIRGAYHDLFHDIEPSDIDWSAWRPLYEEGRTPLAAVDHAFARDF